MNEDEWEEAVPRPPIGTATPAGGSDDDRAAGRLWVPDLAERRGWVAHWVYPDAKAVERRVGFGRRR